MKLQKIAFLILFILVISRYFLTLPKFRSGDKVKITTTLYSEPIIYDKYQYVKFKGLKIYLQKYPEISYGDRLEITGRVDNDKLVDVSFNILEKESVLFSSFRNKIISFYKSSLPEPYSSLLSGITLGSKNMPEAFWEKLKSTGTAHVVVASGTNVTLLTSFLTLALTLFFKRRIAVFTSIAGIIFYLFLSGFDAPIVRASVMSILIVVAQINGRVVESFKILIFTALVMLLIYPQWINDLGFLLSFTATLGIILFEKRINEKVKFLPNLLRESLSSSLSAQIGVIPILLVTFGQFNILSLIINPLILWTVPVIMVFGASCAVLSFIVPFISRMMLFVLFPVLYYFDFILNLFSYNK